MSNYFDAKNFFEVNMIKDFNSEKFKEITSAEIKMLQKCISEPDAYILDVMCGYGRLGNELYKLGYKNLFGVDIDITSLIPEKRLFKFYMLIFIIGNQHYYMIFVIRYIIHILVQKLF